jgi:hypothetical protein
MLSCSNARFMLVRLGDKAEKATLTNRSGLLQVVQKTVIMLSLDTAFCRHGISSSTQHRNRSTLVQTLITTLSKPVFLATMLHACV